MAASHIAAVSSEVVGFTACGVVTAWAAAFGSIAVVLVRSHLLYSRSSLRLGHDAPSHWSSSALSNYANPF